MTRNISHKVETEENRGASVEPEIRVDWKAVVMAIIGLLIGVAIVSWGIGFNAGSFTCPYEDMVDIVGAGEGDDRHVVVECIPYDEQ